MNKYSEEVVLHPLVYYDSRPSTRRGGSGGSSSGSSLRPRYVPVQLVSLLAREGDEKGDEGCQVGDKLPNVGDRGVSSNSSIGVPLFDRDDEQAAKTSKYLIVASNPEAIASSSREFYALLGALALGLLLNAGLTVALFARPGDFDPSLVQTYDTEEANGGVVRMYTSPPAELTSAEQALYAGTLVVLGVGLLGAALRSHILLSGYCAGALLLFLLGLQSAPFAFYYTRYLVDFVCVSIALKLRSSLVTHFSAIDLHRA